MAGIASPIQELRTNLEKSRWLLHEGLLRLETDLQQDMAVQPPPSLPRHGLPLGQSARIMSAALMAGLAAGLSWSRRKR